MFLDSFCSEKNLICAIEDLNDQLILRVWLYLGNSHVNRSHWLSTLFVQLHQHILMQNEEITDPAREETLFLI